jgi:hypothetical protein
MFSVAISLIHTEVSWAKEGKQRGKQTRAGEGWEVKDKQEQMAPVT